MPAPSWPEIDSTQIDAGSPIDTTLMQELVDNQKFVKQTTELIIFGMDSFV